MRPTPFVLLAALWAGAALAAEPLPETSFVVDEAPGFRPVQPALAAYLDRQARRHGLQHFCVIGYEIHRPQDAQAFRIAWVHWREGRRLVYWEPAAADVESKETLVRSRRDLDLRKDVVANRQRVGSSTYLIDRPWLDALLADCRQRGRAYEIRRP